MLNPTSLRKIVKTLWYTLIVHLSPFSNDSLPSKRSVCGDIAKGCEQEHSEGLRVGIDKVVRGAMKITCRFDTSLFSRSVKSFTSLAWKNIHPKCFSCSGQAQSILEVKEILVQFHCLSAHWNDRFRPSTSRPSSRRCVCGILCISV